MQGLQRPAVARQFGSKPVEQFGVRRRFGLQAPVGRAAHQGLAEVPHPDAIGHDSGCEWLLGGDQPAGKFQPPTGFRRDFAGRSDFREDLWHATGNFFGPRLQVIAAKMHREVCGFCLVGCHDHLELRQFLFQLFESLTSGGDGSIVGGAFESGECGASGLNLLLMLGSAGGDGF